MSGGRIEKASLESTASQRNSMSRAALGAVSFGT